MKQDSVLVLGSFFQILLPIFSFYYEAGFSHGSWLLVLGSCQSLVFREKDCKNSFEGIGNQQEMVNNVFPDGSYFFLHFNDSKSVTGYIIINR